MVFCIRTTVVNGGNHDTKRLYDDLLSDNNKLVRLVVKVLEAVTVRMKLKLSQVIDVVRRITILTFGCTKNPSWHEYFLSL